MSTVDPAIDGPPLPPNCPTCGQPARDDDVRLDGAIAAGSYICRRGHIWITRWMLDPPDALTATAPRAHL